MVLQKLLFPNTETCSRFGMFYKGADVNIFMDEAFCELKEGAELSTHTYFNSFSIGKWKKYTNIDNLSLRLTVKGTFQVRVRHAYKMHNEIKDRIIAEKRICAAEKCDVSVNIPIDETIGIYYFQLQAMGEDCTFWGGAYETKADPEAIADVKIAVGICTFRRESYVKHNMSVLRRYILENEASPMYKHLEIFISDNGKTLNPADIETDEIHLFPNKNVGGAGGFTRAMIEAKKVSKKKGITHILMMDDDIRLNPDSLERTYTMLCLLKPEYKDAFIGGHMLKNDTPYIQSEAADHWNIVAHHPVKYNYNLEQIKFLIKNEIEDSVNYFGWWYCCMPISVVNDRNLPLPIFIKRDDIEYGLRNGKQFITMNGICVWHEPFEYKYATYLEYYYFRNMCIMNSRHRLSFNEKTLIEAMKKRVFGFLARYRYKDAELSMLGIQHYLKGIDWLKRQDGEKLNGELMKLGYKKQPVGDVDCVFTHGVYEGNLKPKMLIGRKQRLLRKYTFNGWLLPASKTVVVPAYQSDVRLYYRAKKVINYEEVSNTAFITERNYDSAWYILKMYRETVQMIRRDFKRVTLEYRDRYDELINISFWNEYLFSEGETPVITSELDKPRRPKNTKRQYRDIMLAYLLRLAQLLLFWLPVKKNRVMVSIHDRRGFTCNPKYIVKKLVEMYGDDLEIIWATAHPDTCEEIKALGVKVIKGGSKEQLLAYLRTRFFITNDAFPVWAVHRWNQKWMNTWHAGMNYKHIGFDYLAPMSPIAAKIYKMTNCQPDFYLSGSEFFTEDTSKSFRFDKSVFVPTGLPRNDVFFEDHKDIAEKIRKFYNIDKDKKLVIFAPTFRRGMKSDTYGMDFEKVCDALNKRFGDKWVMLFRNHNFVKGKQKYTGAIDVSAYHDMQELMCAADVLISDYSSCLYDFCMSRRPAFVYAPDLDNYMNNDRSFAYPIEKWPYPIAKSNEELVEAIENFDEKDFAAKVEAHLKDGGAYDNGTASKQAAELIAKYCL